MYFDNLKPVSASQRAQSITVPVGSSAREIGTILEKAGVVRSAWAFEWYTRTNNLRDQLQAGTYSVRPNQSVRDIITILTQGKVASDLVTVLPAQRLDQVRQALINNGFKEAEVEAGLNPALYKDHPALTDKPAGASLEGYLYPESFQKIAATQVQDIIKASLNEMQKHLTPELRAGIVKQGLTLHQGVILASILENEVNSKTDKPIVAQVFLRRLREGHRLQSDVTAFYGAVLDDATPLVTHDSIYNTYLHDGLPPGPISNVSQASLSAVATPADTDYLYFVAGDDGKTYFSHTLEEHQQKTAAHCKKLCS
jgi:UPF0755 protein